MTDKNEWTITPIKEESHPLIGQMVEIPAGTELNRSSWEDSDSIILHEKKKVKVTGFYNSSLKVQLVLPDGSLDLDTYYWHQPEPKKVSK